MTFTHSLSTNNYGNCKFIVATSAANGTHTTIASALAAASSGDTIFIQASATPYTENLTLKSGVNLTAFGCDSFTPNVIIQGNMTASYNGNVTLSGLLLKTNSANYLTVSGSNSSTLNLIDCVCSASNNDGMNINSANFSVVFQDSRIAAASTFKNFSISNGNVSFYQGIFNSGDNTANTISTGVANFFGVDVASIITTSSTGAVNFIGGNWNDNGSNTTLLTTAGTGGSSIFNARLSSGTASTISIGTGTTVVLVNSSVTSSNTNAITGLGTLDIGGVVFTGSSSTINTNTVVGFVEQHGSINLKTALTVPNGGTGQTTLTNHGVLVGAATSAITQLSVGSTATVLAGVTGADPAFTATPSVTSITVGGGTALGNYLQGTWTPVITFGGGSTGITYAVQLGEYTRIGNVVFFSFSITLSNKGSSTGTASITGFPLSDAGSVSGTFMITYTNNITFDALNSFAIGLNSGTAAALFEAATLGSGVTNLTNTHFSNATHLQTNGFYYLS